ncbi:MAG: tetratricopeptide repeat protein [Bacteroidetes bacterium]|nr:MAG: tetratricopeptide repeat protein [Bacteroidota bacterium]REK00414.1 MAG: tetratricopeptide repeat protein [Bacteroidota bacterium]REK05078.1 MAG: tetratricopeptide repeat protein [Bacteroidota bacterium]REK35533.1 MAG: tetratricopeptide repeat protein [Bacteroidota bacterium]
MNNRIEILKQYLSEDPDDNFLRYALALEHFSSGELINAETNLVELLENNPEYLAAYYQLGKTFEALGKTCEAAETYSKGILVAEKQKNMKTLAELKSALEMLEEYN